MEKILSQVKNILLFIHYENSNHKIVNICTFNIDLSYNV